MTLNMSLLVEDARAAGYEIRQAGDDILIMKRVGRWKKARGLMIYSDGFAFDLSVDLKVAKAIRSYKGMRAVLGIS